MFFKGFDFNKKYKNKIEDNSEKIFCRFADTVSHKTDIAAFDLHRDHPPAWELKTILAESRFGGKFGSFLICSDFFYINMFLLRVLK